MSRPKKSKNLTPISLLIEQEDLAFLDKKCKQEKLTRTQVIMRALRPVPVESQAVKTFQLRID